MAHEEITRQTIALIDALKGTTSAFGLAGTGSEYKIVVEIFLYKFFNDKFGYEAKKDKTYGERLRNAQSWDKEYDSFSEEDIEELFVFLPAGVYSSSGSSKRRMPLLPLMSM